MTKGDIFSLVITGLLALGILAAAVLLICGKGGRLLAGYNTMTPEERAVFDERALCRFWGKILLPMGAFLPMAVVGGIYDKVWPALAYLALVLGLVALLPEIFLISSIFCSAGWDSEAFDPRWRGSG